jgi:hypothetical protein
LSLPPKKKKMKMKINESVIEPNFAI